MDPRVTIEEVQRPECCINIRSTRGVLGLIWDADCACGWQTAKFAINKGKDRVIKAAETHLKQMDQLRKEGG